jgi:hypothetical protein
MPAPDHEMNGSAGACLPRCAGDFARRGRGRALGSNGRVAAVVLALALASTGDAVAQTARFRTVDTDSNGLLSYAELVAAFGRRGALSLLTSSDRNGDRQISVMELRQRAVAQQGQDDDDDGESAGSASRGTAAGGSDNDDDGGGNDGGGDDGGSGGGGGGGDDGDDGDDDNDDDDDGGSDGSDDDSGDDDDDD